MKHIFILKPTKDQQFINGIITIMKGYQYIFRYTKDIHDAYTIAKEYHDSIEVCRLYAVGGDGFVHNVANGMVGSNNELVVLPLGTGNDYVRNIFDTKDPLEILKQSLSLMACPVDLIKVNDVYCINVLCCGLDAQVANVVNQRKDVKYIPKPLQYMYSIFKQVIHLKFYPTTINDGKQIIYDDEVVVCAFCKGKYFGGGFKIANEAKLDDGYIDINIIGNINKRELPRYLKALFTYKLNETENYHHYRLKAIDLNSSQQINIDGEILPKGLYHLEIASKAIKLVGYQK